MLTKDNYNKLITRELGKSDIANRPYLVIVRAAVRLNQWYAFERFRKLVNVRLSDAIAEAMRLWVKHTANRLGLDRLIGDELYAGREIESKWERARLRIERYKPRKRKPSTTPPA